MRDAKFPIIASDSPADTYAQGAASPRASWQVPRLTLVAMSLAEAGPGPTTDHSEGTS